MRTVTALLLLLLAAIGGTAHGQALPWNHDRVSWLAPTTCDNGDPISACPVTGYRVETATTATATTWTARGTTAANVLTLTVTGLTPGPHCYRVIALASVNSAPSTVACATTTPPAPNPPVLQTIDTVAFNVVKRLDRFAYVPVGSVPLGTACDATQTIDGFHVVPRATVAWLGALRPKVVVAKCG